MVKLMTRINQADRASIFIETVPKGMVPSNRIWVPWPTNAGMAMILLNTLVTMTIASAMIPLVADLTDKRAIIADNNITK